MKYKITHSTKYQYTVPVSVCHNVVVLTPRESEWVRTIAHRLSVRPTPIVTAKRRDWFGNLVQSFSIEESHRQLVITSTSRIDVQPRPIPQPDTTPSWTVVERGVSEQTSPDWFSEIPFVFDSPRIRRSPEFAAFARKSFPPRRPILAAALDLNHRLHTEFQYDKNATDVRTPTEEAFRKRKGVCQDFAHVAVACLRSLGIPARYVSGYLRTRPPEGEPRLIGADQSHAWVAVYCGPDVGWVDVDPTNDCLCRSDHIPIGWGRDYSDVVPIKGVFLGGGDPALTVSVDVEPQEEAEEE